jgi:hypothetical protein
MGGLNLHAEDTPATKKRNRSPKVILGAVLLLLIPAVGSTLAANITVNTNSTVQFGQGVTATAACDTAMTVTPIASYNGTSFDLETITVSALDTTTGGCGGKTLTLMVYNNTTAQSVSTGSPATQIGFTLPSSAGAVTLLNSFNGTVSNSAVTSSDSLTIHLVTKPAAANVTNITVQSS